jgi:hypothetical protein
MFKTKKKKKDTPE